MRGHLDPQFSMLHYFSPESRVSADHPHNWPTKLKNDSSGNQVSRGQWNKVIIQRILRCVTPRILHQA